MDLYKYAGTHIRVKCRSGNVYEGIPSLYYDEDGTNEWVFIFPKGKSLIEVTSADIQTIEVLPD